MLLAAWQVASYFFPHYLFPPVQDILARTVHPGRSGRGMGRCWRPRCGFSPASLGAFFWAALLAIPIGR